MGRPRKYSNEPLDKVLHIRVTSAMKEKIKEAAAASNLTEYEVIRRRMLGLKIPHKERLLMIHEVRLLRQELARQGGLIKHLYSENPINKEETMNLLKNQNETIKKINSLLKNFEKENINQEA